MDTIRDTDRFIANLIVSWLVTCWVVMCVDRYSYAVPWLRGATPRIEIVVSAAAAFCVLFIIPPVFKFLLRIKPSIFADRTSKKAEWKGRLVGMSVGLLAGIAIQGM
ncbi:hypothetical protein WL30_35160 [Burkholderia ubonensis]|uniref:hypothetical protein n=1 Tax=Burkholderia ubonensis TaxID=101571 RepID=UPI000753CF8D|nr:hypothetical protein [Burkholderia ubonensis]KVU00238.1 hypothetical protein WK60_00870 [Burkholderia ubonensis]KVU81843.1 hypothetical protein WK76_30395 [Burkholderia ubonensis]KWA78789.1 hypothetical protein WL30_35160 [Burkholderia ubonensis]KWB18001.1 hypothetical protein WL31_11565 [Burkholderia ubonensis]KWN77721.1 hypothetical protein WM24_30740 [Burkholderia ubonensis]